MCGRIPTNKRRARRKRLKSMIIPCIGLSFFPSLWPSKRIARVPVRFYVATRNDEIPLRLYRVYINGGECFPMRTRCPSRKAFQEARQTLAILSLLLLSFLSHSKYERDKNPQNVICVFHTIGIFLSSFLAGKWQAICFRRMKGIGRKRRREKKRKRKRERTEEYKSIAWRDKNKCNPQFLVKLGHFENFKDFVGEKYTWRS